MTGGGGGSDKFVRVSWTRGKIGSGLLLEVLSFCLGQEIRIHSWKKRSA